MPALCANAPQISAMILHRREIAAVVHDKHDGKPGTVVVIIVIEECPCGRNPPRYSSNDKKQHYTWYKYLETGTEEHLRPRE